MTIDERGPLAHKQGIAPRPLIKRSALSLPTLMIITVADAIRCP